MIEVFAGFRVGKTLVQKGRVGIGLDASRDGVKAQQTQIAVALLLIALRVVHEGIDGAVGRAVAVVVKLVGAQTVAAVVAAEHEPHVRVFREELVLVEIAAFIQSAPPSI